jgi:hypothetical protein
MDKKRILASLNEVATSLENSGFYNEADEVTVVMKKVAQMPVAPISRPNQESYGYQAAVDKWIATNQQAVNNALQSPMPMQALAPLIMSVQPVELANAIRVKIGQMKQGLA